jgi:hypothetical protein
MAIDIERVRRDFPFLNETLYLNTAAAGISWSGQGLAAAQFYDRMLSRGYDGREEWRAIASRVQGRLARLLKVEPESIGFVGSTTEALNLIAHALAVRSGERVVFAEDEFPSLKMALDVLASKGAELHPVRIDSEARRTDRLCESAEGASIVAVSGSRRLVRQRSTRAAATSMRGPCSSGSCPASGLASSWFAEIFAHASILRSGAISIRRRRQTSATDTSTIRASVRWRRRSRISTDWAGTAFSRAPRICAVVWPMVSGRAASRS